MGSGLRCSVTCKMLWARLQCGEAPAGSTGTRTLTMEADDEFSYIWARREATGCFCGQE